jgi:hypothetical protein
MERFYRAKRHAFWLSLFYYFRKINCSLVLSICLFLVQGISLSIEQFDVLASILPQVEAMLAKGNDGNDDNDVTQTKSSNDDGGDDTVSKNQTKESTRACARSRKGTIKSEEEKE